MLDDRVEKSVLCERDTTDKTRNGSRNRLRIASLCADKADAEDRLGRTALAYSDLGLSKCASVS